EDFSASANVTWRCSPPRSLSPITPTIENRAPKWTRTRTSSRRRLNSDTPRRITDEAKNFGREAPRNIGGRTGAAAREIGASMRSASLLDLAQRIGDIAEFRFAVPWPPCVGAVSGMKMEKQVDRSIGRQIAELRLLERIHRAQRLHEHMGVGDLAGGEMHQGLAGAVVRGHGDQLFVSVESAGFGRDIGAQVANDIAALVDIARIPGRSLGIDEMRPRPANGEK